MKTPESGSRIPSLALALAVSAASADDLYLNDFATRTSKEPIPATNVWQTAQPYPTSGGDIWFANRPSGSAGSYDAASLATYFSETPLGGYGRPSLDGWVMPYYNNTTKLVPRYRHPFDGGLLENPVFTWSYGSSNPQTGCILQPIHNEFTNGQLRIQVDMKAPLKWVRAKVNGANEPVSTLKLFPVYRKYMDILAWGGDLCDTVASPGKFGLRSSLNVDNASCLRTFPQYWDTRNNDGGTTQLGNNDNDGAIADNGEYGKTNYWFRFIVTYDLDGGTFSGETYRFAVTKGHPTFNTAPSDTTAKRSFSGATVMAPLTAETGGIAGFALSSYGRFNGNNAANAGNKVFVDNIRLSWKAPGASDFEVFYENDFITRRYRTLCAPAPAAATGAYVQSTGTVTETDTFSGYETGTDNQIVPNRTSLTDANPIGIDGWRRLPHSYSNGRPAVFAYGGNATYDAGGTGGNMLSFGYQDGYARLVQTLGTSFSSGTVRIAADVWLPEGASLASQSFTRRVGVGLGAANLYYANADAILDNLAAGFGYERLAAAGASSHQPYAIASGGSDNEPMRVFPASYTAPESNWWYRIEVSANLDTRKYGITVTPIGATSVTASDALSDPAIFSESGLDLAADVSDIGSFYIQGYGWASSNENVRKLNRVCFDNLRVYHDDDLVYENDFTSRTRTLPAATRETGDLAALQYNLDGGQDHWVRRDYTGPAGFDARAWVRDDDGNQFLALGHTSEAGRTITLVNGLGLSQTKPFRFEADIRPPRQWSAASGSATISLGDSQMLQTEAPESFYGAHRLVSFGFDGTNTANQAGCPYYFAGCKAQVGGTALDADIDETHWYRFRLDVDPEDGICDAKLYDMGTTHPTAETKGGTLVATATDITFENALAAGEGVSTILIEGDGLSGAVGSLGVDPAHVLVDNLRLSVPTPFTLVIR